LELSLNKIEGESEMESEDETENHPVAQIKSVLFSESFRPFAVDIGRRWGCPKRASFRTFRQPADPILNIGRRCRIGVRHDEIDNITVTPRPFLDNLMQ